MTGEATFSPCRRYRYALWRRWGEGDQVLFVMLNPSTADPVGTDNDDWLRRLASESALVVAAWGNRGRLRGRSVAGREDVKS